MTRTGKKGIGPRPAAESADYTASCYRSILQEVGAVLSYTKGVSMRPLIWSGRHYVGIVPVEGEPRIGDILLFEQIRRGETACILHRLVAIERDSSHSLRMTKEDSESLSPIYITRGDNCLGCERIMREDIIGKVSDIYRNGGDRPHFALHGEHIGVEDASYLRYVRFWNAIWPLRRMLYGLRAAFYSNPFSQKVLKPIYRMLFRR